MDELTAWEEINPQTVLARLQERLSRSLARLEPATSEQFRDELTACLALVVPVGMTEEGRREWLAVAWGTLRHLPADLLALGCAEARKTCDHPSKIVPTIISATKEAMAWRHRRIREDSEATRPRLAKPEYPPIPHEETQRILREVRESMTATSNDPAQAASG